MLHFFVCVVFFLLERDRKRKNCECDGLGNSLQNEICFSLLCQKLFLEDAFLVAKVLFLIIYHDFLPTPKRGSHVKSDKTHTQSSRHTP